VKKYIALMFALIMSLSTAFANDLLLVTKKTYMDISIGGKPEGRIVIGLFGNWTVRSSR